jgi:hypothetical protein
MIIASFSRNGETIEVEILDLFEAGGVELASVKALEGLPFADGARTTIKTAYKTVKACELQPAVQGYFFTQLAYDNGDYARFER